MASITIRNLDDEVKKRLRRQAAENGRSVEAEAREILSRNADGRATPPLRTGLDLFRGLREAVERYGGVELEFPSRTSKRPVNILEETATFQSGLPPKPRRKRKK